MSENKINQLHLLREKSSHIVKAARSATAANILAPLLCIPMFKDEVRPSFFYAWLGYMLFVVAIRTTILYKLEFNAEKIMDPQTDLKKITFAIGLVGLGWGMGWPLMAVDLSMVNRMIYVYMTTAAMISSMFAYSVNGPTFYSFTLPIMIPAMSTLMWPINVFPWPFAIGLASLYLVVLGISRSFSKTFEDSVNLRFRNELLYQELANERDQSVAANVAKSKFIAAASHDLRQPLHAVNLHLGLVNYKNLADEENKIFQKIKNGITVLNTMFDSLLNMSKLDAHITEVNEVDFYLSDLNDLLIEIVKPRASAKGILLEIESPPLQIKGDKLILQQILLNLALNAVQYTEQGHVKIKFWVESGALAVSVVDSGVGISAFDLQNIFNEFYRADFTRSAHEGLGLGLTIVKRLSELIDASVKVNSTQGIGSDFTVITRYSVVERQNKSLDASHYSLSADLDRSSSLKGKRIAIIEDDGIIVDAYRQTIAEQGAQVIVLSETLEELQNQLESVDYIDCILSDYRLKQTTGNLIIQKLREDFNCEIPAVIVTADTSPEHIHLFAELNVPILYKPVTFQKVLSTLEAVLQNNKA